MAVEPAAEETPAENLEGNYQVQDQIIQMMSILKNLQLHFWDLLTSLLMEQRCSYL